jgi:hypothetical protein
MNNSDIAALMAGMAPVIRDYVVLATAKEVAPLLARIAELEARPIAKDGEPGSPGTSVTVDDIRPLIVEAVAKIPAPKDGASVTADDVRPMLQEMVAALPPAEKGADADPAVIERMVSEAVAKIPAPKDGASVTADDVRPMLQEMVAALPPAEKGADADPAVIERMVSEAVAKIPAPEPGKEGPPGKLPIVSEWKDQVHYEGRCVTHDGATYQALRDTGREPPHDDWRCIARSGSDGRSFEVRGTFDPECKDYKRLNVVALGGAGFVARKDDPGLCPGEGWQLIAAQGKRGNPGEPGKAVKGDPGPPGPRVIDLSIDDDGRMTLTNADRSTVELDLYPLLIKVQSA